MIPEPVYELLRPYDVYIMSYNSDDGTATYIANDNGTARLKIACVEV
jgi:hypothetical protein